MSPLRAVLHEGTRMLLRRVEAEDRDRLVAGFARLSPESRYQRFHHTVDHLDEDQLTLFTDVDQTDHLAWVALDEDDPAGPGAAVIRAIRMEDEPTVAEIAVTTADAYQGRGVGTLLLAVIAADAAAHGITILRSWVMEDNEPMLSTFRQLDAEMGHDALGAVQVDQTVVTVADDLPDTTAGRVARQLIEHLDARRDEPLRLGDHSGAPPPPPAPRRRSGQERGGLRDWLDAEMPDLP
jgi:GNAT superfamily N-acetyltransferase